MKKIYLLTIMLALVSTMISAQNMLQGSTMEDGNAWMTSSLNQDAGNTVTYDFNYTTDKPSQGTGGCLHVAGTNTGTAGGNLTNFMFYQHITLQRGIVYKFDAAYKDVRSNNYWIEVYVGGVEPAEGSDYGTAQQAVLVDYIKSSNWEGDACPNDEVDGLFSTDGCYSGTLKDSVFFEGTGDTTVYFGFRMGIWDDGGNGYTFETYIDNVTLNGPESTGVKEYTNNIEVYPNPFNDLVVLKSSSEIEEVNIVNIVGQSVMKLSANVSELQLNLSDLSNGVYFMIVKDTDANTSVHKLVKD